MPSFLSNWAIADSINLVLAIIALSALFRPEVSRLARHWVNKIDIFSKDWVEVGFSNFGPTLGAILSVRATPNDQFVSNMTAQVVRLRDKSTHSFDWAVERPLTVTVPSLDSLRLATSFSIKPNEPKSLNIQFHDRETRSRIDAPTVKIQNAWMEYLKSRQILPAQLQRDSHEKIYKDFTQAPQALVAQHYNDLERELYWEPGGYEVTLRVETFDPTMIFEKAFHFTLNDEEVRRLKLNLIWIIRSACSFQDGVPNFIHSQTVESKIVK